jgi:hypothetical protein
MTQQQKRNFLNKKLNTIQEKNLSTWLNRASSICPELSEALDGIYCGEQGRIHQELGVFYSGLYITMGWYKITSTKVEYAYIN